MNNIDRLFRRRNGNVLSIYFTAGYPALEDTVPVIETLRATGVDMIEIGIPFSDPMADGPVIQRSSEQALRNGMTLQLLFRQLATLNPLPEIPLVMMGYLNPILRFGMEAFLEAAVAVGVAGVILPDLPLEVYEREYRSLFEARDIRMIFLITPHTPEERVRALDKASRGFVYMVTSAGTTGASSGFGPDHVAYFTAVQEMKLTNPVLAGFGIHDQEGFATACRYVQGGIIGSAFIKKLSIQQPAALHNGIRQFIQSLRP